MCEAVVTVDAKAHGELLTPHILAALEEADRTFADVDAIVCGIGPGPFTGLRAGMATAAALGQAPGKPVYPVCTLDAIAADSEGPLLVASDARRKEIYWAAYNADGKRVAGPSVDKPADVVARIPSLAVERVAGNDKRRHELAATSAGRALFRRAVPLWATAENEVRAAMGSRLTADLHGAIDRSMEKLAAL